MKNRFKFFSIVRLTSALVLVGSLVACASTKMHAMDDPAKFIVIGVTARNDLQKVLGSPDEKMVTGDSSDVWVYRDVMEVPLLVSLIPVVGDVADAAQMMHKKRELIVQFDPLGVVKKIKVRSVE